MRESLGEICAAFERYWREFKIENRSTSFTKTDSDVADDPLYSQYLLSADGVREYRKIIKENVDPIDVFAPLRGRGVILRTSNGGGSFYVDEISDPENEFFSLDEFCYKFKLSPIAVSSFVIEKDNVEWKHKATTDDPKTYSMIGIVRELDGSVATSIEHRPFNKASLH